MKKVIIIVISIVFVFCFAGCTATDVKSIKVVKQSINNENEVNLKKKIFNEMISVITDRGFDIKIMNEENGIINTEWRQVKDESGEQALQVLFVDMSAKVTRYISLAVRIDENSYKIKVQAKMNQVSGIRNSSKDEFKELTENEMKFIEEMINTVNKNVKIENNYTWQIETIDNL